MATTKNEGKNITLQFQVRTESNKKLNGMVNCSVFNKEENTWHNTKQLYVSKNSTLYAENHMFSRMVPCSEIPYTEGVLDHRYENGEIKPDSHIVKKPEQKISYKSESPTPGSPELWYLKSNEGNPAVLEG